VTEDNNEYVFSGAILAQIDLSNMSGQAGEWRFEPPICNLLVSMALVIIFILNVHADCRRFIDAAWGLESKEVNAFVMFCDWLIHSLHWSYCGYWHCLRFI
jgi:hypothetical protein